MGKINAWIVAHPLAAAVLVALVAALITLVISSAFHPAGFSHAVGKLWLAPLLALLSYLLTFLPMSKAHRR